MTYRKKRAELCTRYNIRKSNGVLDCLTESKVDR